MNLAHRPSDMRATTQAAEGLPRRRWSVAEIEEMVRLGIVPEDERFELIGGEVVPMSPKGLRHERLKTALNRFWGRRLPEAFGFSQETTFRLNRDTFVEPDFVFFRAADGLARLSAETALLAVEVTDTSLEHDLKRKTLLFAAHGVREVWVIDAETLETHIRRLPGAEGYREWLTLRAEEPLALPFSAETVTTLSELPLP